MIKLKTNITRSEKSVNVFSHSFNVRITIDHCDDWTITPATITIRNSLAGTEKKITLSTNYWDIKNMLEASAEANELEEKDIRLFSKSIAKEIEREIVLFLRSEI